MYPETSFTIQLKLQSFGIWQNHEVITIHYNIDRFLTSE